MNGKHQQIIRRWKVPEVPIPIYPMPLLKKEKLLLIKVYNIIVYFLFSGNLW